MYAFDEIKKADSEIADAIQAEMSAWSILRML